MIDFLIRLFNYECPCCNLLKKQLEYEETKYQEVLTTLTSLLKPQVIVQPEVTQRVITPRHQIWSRRKAELERLDLEEARVKANSPLIGKSDSEMNVTGTATTDVNGSIQQLEMELGIVDEVQKKVN